ncbi:helix-turn-helix domain-containing protein [Paenibacillus tyrfis]|uniref:DNA-binding protein n=1 Tax=Paenibacillus tyrfis TaxID=1501230 RepID=A0A081P772_9BACL|nr:XRE family transcriptional regulator [Paenibacillus tyrfis]KEQ26545.1 DNA-binding protein [Paenibacillus tyrfis]
MEHEQIHKKIGKSLQAIRKARSLSLDQVAELTGVSKAMLGQIERGDSNPTISILWKIVNGLRISFTSLIEEEPAKVTHFRFENLEPFVEEEGRYRAFPLVPFDQQKRFEIYTVEMEANCTHISEPHNEGIEEYILIMQGELDITIQQKTYTLKVGDALRFTADQSHIYTNKTDQKTMYHNIILYPS